MNTTGLIIESQPDWLTAAAHTKQHADTLWALGHAWVLREQRSGGQRRRFYLQGYEGTQAGRARVGQKHDWTLVQLSGDLAAQYLDDVLPLSESVSRLDLACTVRLDPSIPHVAEHHYVDYSIFTQVRPQSANGQLVCSTSGGATFYLGSRASPYFLRVYNKEVERLDANDLDAAARYQGCWRYELEVKGPPTEALARAVQAAPDRADYTQRYIHEYCVQHGIEPHFSRSGGVSLIPGFTRRSDRHKTLEWMQRQVKPSIGRLLRTGDNAEVWQALGLPPETPHSDSETDD